MRTMLCYLRTTIATTVILLAWFCQADLQPMSRFDNMEETVQALLDPGLEDSIRHLQPTAVCALEDTFLYDTYIDLQVFGSNVACSDLELDEIGADLTEAHQNVLHVDPRLDDVVELLVNMCETPTNTQRRRELSFTTNGNGYGYNWSGSGRCKWCPPTNEDCDHGCRLRRLYNSLMGREDMSSRRERRRLQTGTIDGFKLWSTKQQNNPNLLKQLEENDTIDQQLYGTEDFSIEAMYSGDVSRVHFFFDNEYHKTETSIPFFLSGDGGSYSYIYTAFPLGQVGSHSIKAIPISSYGYQGTAVTLNFEVVSGGGSSSSSGSTSGSSTIIGVSAFKLWNTEFEWSPQVVKEMADNDQIDRFLYGSKLAIEAEVSPEVGFIDWYIDGSYYRKESLPPYFTNGDGGDYSSVASTSAVGYLGTHTVEARPYSPSGSQLTSLEITFTVVDTSPFVDSDSSDEEDSGSVSTPAPTIPGEITGFKLWNTTDQTLPQFIKLLVEGEDIDVQQYGSSFTVEAEVIGDIAKVNFGLDQVALFEEDFQAPFVLYGDANYQFLPTAPTLSEVGVHTVTATPFSSSGVQLTPASISFGIIDTSSVPPPPEEEEDTEELADGYLTGFLLWDTSVSANPKFIKKLAQADVIDIAYYGPQLSVEAEYTGTLKRVDFGLDGNKSYRSESTPPYMLGGDSGGSYTSAHELATVGTHTIEATPYDLSGAALPAMSLSFLTVDGSTNLGSMSLPDARTELINLLEDDLSFFLSGVINAKYFFKSDHCLQWNLVFVKVELIEVSNPQCEAPLRRKLLPDFLDEPSRSLRHG